MHWQCQLKKSMHRKEEWLTESAVDGGSAIMRLRMCSKAPESLQVVGTMVKEEENELVVKISMMGLRRERHS
jgi:CO dehydrogenase/acetyl-CoA synthase epsilon subunit